MVAISVFLVVIMYGMTALLNANLVHNKSQNMRSILDNLSFIMEDMSRNIRTGYNYYCITGNDSLSNFTVPKSGQNCWGIAFESANGDIQNPNDQWVYAIDSLFHVRKATQAPYDLNNFTSFLQLTPDEVKIDTTKSGFSVLGAPAPDADYQQPFVIIRLSGTITYKNITTTFSLQTSVSQRVIDI